MGDTTAATKDLSRYKYAHYLAAHKRCPRNAAACISEQVFRWVWNPLCEKSFTPIALLPTIPGRPWQCVDYALSMFQTKDEARAAFVALEGRFQNAKERYGDHIGTVALQPNHGDRTKTDHDGHFDLFEFVNIDLVPSSAIVEPL